MVKIIDASALMVYLEKGPGYEKVIDLFVKAAESGKYLLMSTVNFGEVFYVLVNRYGLDEAEKIRQIIETFPIQFIPVDLSIAKQAALYKSIKKLPYVDCFVAALAKLRKGEIITTDSNFKVLEGEIKICWIT